MKTLSGGMIAMLGGNVTLALCLRITPKIGAVILCTDHDTDITVGSETFLASLPFTCSAIATSIGTAAASYTITAALAGDISRANIEAGALDMALMEVMAVDHKTPTNGLVLMFSGFANVFKYSENLTVDIDVLSLLALNNTIGDDIYQPTCRVDFGDAKCGIDINPLKKNATITAVTNRQTFTCDDTSADNTFNFGTVLFTSGANEGFACDLATSKATGVLVLQTVTPYPIAVSDTITIYPGCSKIKDDTAGGCLKYANVINFRGEAFLVDSSVTNSTINTGGDQLANILSRINASVLK